MEKLKEIRKEMYEIQTKIDTLKKRLKILMNEQETEINKLIEKGD